MKMNSDEKNQLNYDELVEEIVLLNLIIDSQQQTMDANLKTIRSLLKILKTLRSS